MKKKDGFCKNLKNIFSRTGLTGSLSPQRASRLFALTLSSASARRRASLDADPAGPEQAPRPAGGTAGDGRAPQRTGRGAAPARPRTETRSSPRHFTLLLNKAGRPVPADLGAGGETTR